MKRLVANIPKNVLVATATLLVCAALFTILYFTLGTARDGAIESNTRLLTQLQQAIAAANTSEGDGAYVAANVATYESLLKSDRLIPHTRRAAILRLQDSARLHGLSAVQWTFNAVPNDSPQAALNQPLAKGYRLSVEEIGLKIGAPYDGPIYSFLADVTNSFPGAAILQSIELDRATGITDVALRAVSEGRDSGLVEGDIKLIWRTAQAQEEEKK